MSSARKKRDARYVRDRVEKTGSLVLPPSALIRSLAQTAS
jgi:hypothetical protein